jgi:class 3 adenylate cyclase
MAMPDTSYARSGDISIAYQVVGAGPLDLILIRGSLSELTTVWEQPLLVGFIEGLTSFARVVLFDKRGMGLSDRLRDVPTLEARMDDVRSVMDAAGLDRAALFAAHEGARIALLFAATYPERTTGLVLYDPSARGRRAADYPWGRSDEEWRRWLREVSEGWGRADFFERYLSDYSPTIAANEEFRAWFVRHMRQSASPGAAVAFQRMVMEGDVTDVLPAVRTPALVLSRADSAGATEYVASRIPGAVWKEVPGLIDGYSWVNPGANEFILRETEAFLRGRESPPAPDRVLTTILFTDIVGSTEQATALGDTSWKALLDRHDALVRQKLAQYRGEELSTTGDGFVAAFDGPGRAIHCASAIVDGVRALDLEIRAGIHTGEGEIAGGKLGGIVLNIAARVMGEAGPSDVVVSSTVKDLVAGAGIEFEDRGHHVLKGVPEQWRLFAVRR